MRREIWAHWLAYNMIRTTIAQAALAQGERPRELSFAAGLAAVASSWAVASIADQGTLASLANAMSRLITHHRVGDRPDWIEPRAVKRRPKSHALLDEPREQARARLRNAEMCTSI